MRLGLSESSLMYAPPQSIPSWKFTSYLEWTWNRGYLHGARSLRDVLRCVSPDLARRISSLHEQKDEESGAKGNVLQDQRFVLEDEGFGQQGGDGVMSCLDSMLMTVGDSVSQADLYCIALAV